MKPLKLFMVLLVGIMLVGMVSAAETHTATTDTTCTGNVCTKTLYSGIVNVYEDNQWKDIEDARSLMGSGIVPVVLEDDKEFPVEVVDFNYTSITVKLNPKGIKIFSEDIPLRVWNTNDEKAETFRQDVIDGKEISTGITDYKKEMDKVVDSKVSFSLLNQEETKTYDFAMGSILEFGYNSTTITLSTPMETARLVGVAGQDTNTNAGQFGVSGGTVWDAGSGAIWGIARYNISSIPSSATISYAYFNITSSSHELNTNEWVYMGSHKINISYQWSSTIPTTINWDNRPTTNLNINMTSDTYNNYTWLNNSGTRLDFNILNMIKDSHNNGDNNISILVTPNQSVISSVSFDEINFNSAKTITITYTIPLSINITYPTNGTNYTTLPTTLNWTVGGDLEETCWYSNDSGATNTTVTCGDLQTSITPVEGSNTYYMWANDSSNNIVTDNVTFNIDSINPSTSLIYPTATSYTVSPTQLNFSATDTNIDTCWYSVNATSNVTLGDCTTNVTGLTATEGSNTWTIYANDTYGRENESSVTFSLDTSNPAVTLIYPTATNYSTLISQLNFSATDTNLDTCWYSTNATTNVTHSCTTNVTGLVPSQGSNTWTIYANDTYGRENESSVTFLIDSINPAIQITTPSQAFYFYDRDSDNQVTVQLNWTVSDTNLNTCWYYNGTANTTITCGNNVSLTLTYGSYDFVVYANDTYGNFNSSSYTVRYGALVNNSETYNASTYETSRESFVLNFTYPSTKFTAVAKLIYDGTARAGTITGAGDTRTATASFDIPSGITATENISFYWNISLTNVTGTYNYTIQDHTQSTENITFSLCSATNPTVFLNYTFKDEDTSAVISAAIDSSTFYYWLGDGDVKKLYSYSNATINSEYNFCFKPNKTLQNTISLIYSNNVSSYAARTEDSSDDLTNTTTNTILYLLGTGGTTDTSLLVLDSYGYAISGAGVKLERLIDGSWVQVGQGTTDGAGIKTFGVNTDYDYQYTVSHADYVTEVFTIRPTSAGYTITLAAISTNVTSAFRGILFSIRPTDEYLINDTSYEFAFNLTSNYSNIDGYGFDLRLVNGTIITGGSETVEDTEITLNYDVNNQTRIYMDYYWIIDGDYINSTTSWLVYDNSTSRWGLNVFLDDLELYLDSGIFGIDTFGRLLIAFIIMFLFVGIMSYKYGFVSPMAITTLIFGVVFLLDVVTPILPDIRGVSNLPTFLAGLILVLAIINEVRQR